MFQQIRLFQFKEPPEPVRFRWPVQFDDGTLTCSVVPEKKGKKTYWYMRKSVGGRTINKYLAPAGKLTEELLDNAVKNIKAQMDVTQAREVVQ